MTEDERRKVQAFLEKPFPGTRLEEWRQECRALGSAVPDLFIDALENGDENGQYVALCGLRVFGIDAWGEGYGDAERYKYRRDSADEWTYVAPRLRGDGSTLWALLALPTSLSQNLDQLTDQELRSACIEYFQLRADLVFAIQDTRKDGGASEDILDDLAETILRRGRGAVEATLRGAYVLPERDNWNALERHALRATFISAWERRFSDDLFDAIERS